MYTVLPAKGDGMETIMKIDKKMLIPLIFAVGFIPAIVRAYLYECGLNVFSWYPDAANGQTDFFLYYKGIALIITSVIMILILFYLHSKRKLKINIIYGMVIAYGVCVLFSGLFSEYKSFAFRGSYEIFESVPVILSYLMISYYAYIIVGNGADMKRLMIGIGCGYFLVTLIGFFQAFGYDLFRTRIGKQLITPQILWEDLETLSFTFQKGISYTTLYNTNYLAQYFGIAIPIITMLIFGVKDYKKKIALIIIDVMSLVTLVASGSKTGLIILLFVAVIGLVIYNGGNWKRTIAIGGSLIVLLIGVFVYRYGNVTNLMASITGSNMQSTEYALTDIETTDENVRFVINNQELFVSYVASEDNATAFITCLDSEGNDLPYDETKGDEFTKVLQDTSYGNCSVKPVLIDDKIAICVNIDGHEYYFSNQVDGTYYYYNPAGKYVKFPHNEKSKLFPDSLFSGRGLIWNNIIPKLKKCILFGTGANTFIMEYPQDNYIHKTYLGTQYLFDAKAHCMYLQQFLENGLIALLLILAIGGYYIITSFALYIKVKEHTFEACLGKGCFLGITAYLIACLTNDSNVTTAPVFWGMLGIGVALNEILKKEMIKKERIKTNDK